MLNFLDVATPCSWWFFSPFIKILIVRKTQEVQLLLIHLDFRTHASPSIHASICSIKKSIVNFFTRASRLKTFFYTCIKILIIRKFQICYWYWLFSTFKLMFLPHQKKMNASIKVSIGSFVFVEKDLISFLSSFQNSDNPRVPKCSYKTGSYRNSNSFFSVTTVHILSLKFQSSLEGILVSKSHWLDSLHRTLSGSKRAKIANSFADSPTQVSG